MAGRGMREKALYLSFSYPLDDCFERVIKIGGGGEERKKKEEEKKKRRERRKKKGEKKKRRRGTKRCANAFETVKELIRGERLVYAIASTLKNLRIVLSIFLPPPLSSLPPLSARLSLDTGYRG